MQVADRDPAGGAAQGRAVRLVGVLFEDEKPPRPGATSPGSGSGRRPALATNSRERASPTPRSAPSRSARHTAASSARRPGSTPSGWPSPALPERQRHRSEPRAAANRPRTHERLPRAPSPHRPTRPRTRSSATHRGERRTPIPRIRVSGTAERGDPAAAVDWGHEPKRLCRSAYGIAPSRKPSVPASSSSRPARSNMLSEARARLPPRLTRLTPSEKSVGASIRSPARPPR